MDTPKQQLIDLIKRSEQILICTHENPDGDALGSSLALQHVLDRLGKHATVVASGKKETALNYLNNFASILDETNIKSEPEFLIVLDESSTKAKNVEVRRVDNNHIALVVTTEQGSFTPEQVKFEPGKYSYDLIIALDCANKEQLGALYQQHERLFQNVPTVVIDHHLGHQPFGTVDYVEEKAAATAEILVSIIEALGQNNGRSVNLIDQHVATCLLTGLITDTGSFQNSNTTPKSLTVAAQMLASEADHRTIINRVFMNRPLSQLRLWGRALSNIKEDKPLRFAWATLAKADFVASQANEEEITGLIDSMLKSAAGTDFVVLLTERKGGIHGSFRSIKDGVDVERLAKLFGGGGHKQAAAFFTPNANLAEYEQRIVNLLRKEQRDKINNESIATNQQV